MAIRLEREHWNAPLLESNQRQKPKSYQKFASDFFSLCDRNVALTEWSMITWTAAVLTSRESLLELDPLPIAVHVTDEAEE
jgi:hypothetical protein